MATKTLRPRLTSLTHPSTHLQLHQRRAFLPNPFQSPFNPLSTPANQTLTATRILPYPPHPIYAIISDIPSYSTFLPYCQSSAITHWSAPDSIYHKKWPSEAKLVVGFGHLTESFTSRIFCVPGRIVESVGGGTETELDQREIAHHLAEGGDRGAGAKEAGGGLLTHLRSRWTIDALPKEGEGVVEKTKVTLSLEYAFANPLYSTLSAGAAPKVAEMMIKAFEERVRSLLDGAPRKLGASLGGFEGSKADR